MEFRVKLRCIKRQKKSMKRQRISIIFTSSFSTLKNNPHGNQMQNFTFKYIQRSSRNSKTNRSEMIRLCFSRGVTIGREK